MGRQPDMGAAPAGMPPHPPDGACLPPAHRGQSRDEADTPFDPERLTISGGKGIDERCDSLPMRRDGVDATYGILEL